MQTVFLVEDHPLFQRGLTELLEREGDLHVVGVAASADAARQVLRKEAVDLVILDLSLQQGSGLELIEELACSHPDLTMLVLSSRDERVYAERVLNAGASGFVSKDEDPKVTIAAVRAVLAGDIFLSPEMHQRLLKQQLDRPGASPTQRNTSKQSGHDRVVTDLLSNRELQVFEAIGLGRTTQQIADSLHLSSKTVETRCGHRTVLIRTSALQRFLCAPPRVTPPGVLRRAS